MVAKSETVEKEGASPSHRRYGHDTYRLISLIPILPHHHVADIGCGTGYFTVPLAKFVFDGKVYALDVRQKMLDATREALEALNLTNVEPMLLEEKKLPLEDESLDGAIIAFGLGGADGARALLKDTLRCLRKSGWLAILEWHKREMDEGPPLRRRMDEDKLRGIVQKLGFRLKARRDFNGKQYVMLMRK